jgi:hypothetical protein
MAKIKNMGTSTMSFKEGIIVSGSSAQKDGTYSDYALIVTGSMFIDAQGNRGLTIFKEESESAFIRFVNSDDPTSWYAYMAMDAAENLYIFPGRSQDFTVRSRTGVSNDPIKFPFRVFDNGKAKFEHGQTDSNESGNDLPADVVFYVSGSTDGENSTVFGGDVVVSGSLYAKQKHFTTHKYTDLGTADAMFVRFNAASSDPTGGVNNNFIAPANGKIVSVTIRSSGTPGNTEIAFCKLTDGNGTFGSGTSSSDFTVNIASANTGYTGFFTSSDPTFAIGNALGIRINPTNSHGNVDLTVVWEFDWVS